MELSIQIKKYRTELHLSQEELAEKVYVTRQTISNWENEKSYPDIHSLLLLSSLFNISLDQLIKGDIEKMKEIISEQEIKKFNYYGSIYTVHLAVLIISAVPLFMWLGRYAYIPFGILFIITMYWALKVSCTFKVMDGEKLDFKSGSFDVVISRNLTWTLPDAAGAYREWIRVLRPGGILLFS